MNERHRVFSMKLRDVFMIKIASNEKNVDARIASQNYLKAKIGDIIKFVCGRNTLSRKILGITKYANFREMLIHEGLKNCLPGCNAIDDGVRLYHSFKNYKSMEAQYGVIAFKLGIELPNLTDENAELPNLTEDKPKRRYGELVKPKSCKKTDAKGLLDSPNDDKDMQIDPDTIMTDVDIKPLIEDIESRNHRSLKSVTAFDGSQGVIKKSKESETLIADVKSEDKVKPKRRYGELVKPKSCKKTDAKELLDSPNDDKDMQIDPDTIMTDVDIKPLIEGVVINLDDSEDSLVCIETHQGDVILIEDTESESENDSDSECKDSECKEKRSIKWIRTGKTYTMPQELWDAVYINGSITPNNWTLYKNKIGDDFDKQWPCILILSHKNVGKTVISMQGKCKHGECRAYHFKAHRKNFIEGDSPTFNVRVSKEETIHKHLLTRQLRGIQRIEHGETLKHCKAATLSRQLMLDMDENQHANNNANTTKSDLVIQKVRSEALLSNDLARDDFEDMVKLQEATADDKYISKVLSPFAVYLHSKIQYKVLEQYHKRKQPDEEVVGFTDATGDVVKSEKQPILYYTLLLPIKGDPTDKHHMLFPLTESLNSAHATPNVTSWLSDFNEEFIKECPTINPPLHRIVSNFSYCNFHAILHTFQSMRIQQYIYLCYKFAAALVDFSALRNITKVETSHPMETPNQSHEKNGTSNVTATSNVAETSHESTYWTRRCFN